MAQRWTNFKKNLYRIPDVALTRWLRNSPSCQLQLHAFSDASRRAMAAIIVLHWLHSSIPVGNSLINNYISHIQEIMPSIIWGHVPSQLNPEDVASRGAKLTTLTHDNSWFEGPDWLRESPFSWPCSSLNFASVNVSQIVADAMRLRLKRPSTVPILSPITANEFNYAFYACVLLSQRHHFAPELVQIRTREGYLSRQSPLKGLDVFVDPIGILREGGRLQHSSLSYNARRPPTLSSADPSAKLVITWAHHRALHGVFRSTYVHVVRRAWIIGGKRQIQAHIHRCVVCIRAQPRPIKQAISPLPLERVTSVRGFTRNRS
ncbi:uncharacterized protein LOC117170881 [Belonocnema kinseyi]|uniref:uncharacterized protein LOC117170881 n=1 Tax=Belonocnema kinseyi TaxID=2817044 RepID=UPI00143E0DFF|nr:uncharacterized protein LOC117170881 [Belonocnema kinseyi]